MTPANDSIAPSPSEGQQTAPGETLASMPHMTLPLQTPLPGDLALMSNAAVQMPPAGLMPSPEQLAQPMDGAIADPSAASPMQSVAGNGSSTAGSALPDLSAAPARPMTSQPASPPSEQKPALAPRQPQPNQTVDGATIANAAATASGEPVSTRTAIAGAEATVDTPKLNAALATSDAEGLPGEPMQAASTKAASDLAAASATAAAPVADADASDQPILPKAGSDRVTTELFSHNDRPRNAGKADVANPATIATAASQNSGNAAPHVGGTSSPAVPATTVGPAALNSARPGLAEPRSLTQNIDLATQGNGATNGQSLTQLSPTATSGSPQSAAGSALPEAARPVPVTQLAVHIASQAQAGNQRFDIRLDPPELGRVDIRLEVNSDGQTLTHLAVEKSETLDMLQRDQRLLERALQQAGLNARDGSMSFSLRDDARGGQQQSNSNDNNSGGRHDSDEPQDITTVTKQFETSAGLDISV